MYLLVSALLGFMVVAGWLGRNNLAKLRLDVQFPDEIYDGVETLVTVRLYNRQRWLPACLLKVELEGEDASYPILVRDSMGKLPLAVTFRGRGVRQLQAIRVSSTFPINFFIRSLALPVLREILVFPRPRPIALPSEVSLSSVHGPYAKDKGYEGDLTHIDDYRGGEPLKLIHWKISARQDQLKVKELSSLAAPPLIIDPQSIPGKNLEERLGGACWLVKTLCRSGRNVGLQLDGGRIPPACSRQHQLRLLGALARYGFDTYTA